MTRGRGGARSADSGGVGGAPTTEAPAADPDGQTARRHRPRRRSTTGRRRRTSLEKGRAADKGPDPRDHDVVGRKLVETLGHFGVEAKIVGIVSGPHVSRYELRLAPGTKVKKVTELTNDLAYALASTDIRILAPIPGKQAVGVEVPNARRRMVRLGDIYAGRPEKTSPLVAWLGKGIDGNAVWTDLAKMPHVLVAGTTGSGKSGCVNAILSSILMQASPNEVRLVLVDPKQVELNHYEHVPHLLTPVVTSPRLAANVLANLIGEMESRYGIMGEARCRNLGELNRARARKGEPPLPHILCVIDELADLMMVAPAEVEDSIIRLAQKSRATGIHLVLATQRPSTDIITGTIKVNIPARIAFAVSSQTDSRVILDQGGAEALLGQGDMLFRGAGTSKLQRIQGAFVTEEEIARITGHWAKQGEPEFEAELLEAREEKPEEGAEGEFDPDSDDLLDEAIRLVVQTETASVSMIQRRLRVGYTRAGRLIDMLERRGVISGYEGSKPRQVLITAGRPSPLPRRRQGGRAAAGRRRVAPFPAARGHNVGVESRHRKHPARRAKSAQNRPFRGRGRRPRSGSASCGRSRTRSGTSSRARSTPAPSSRPTPPTSASTASGWPRSYRRGRGRRGPERAPARVEPALSARRSAGADRGVGGRILAVVVVAALIGIRGRDRARQRRRRLLSKKSGSDARGRATPKATPPAKAAASGVAVSLEATDEVWVCLLDAAEEPVINGQILGSGRTGRAVPLEGILGRLRQRLGRDGDRRQPAPTCPNRRARSGSRSTERAG